MTELGKKCKNCKWWSKWDDMPKWGLWTYYLEAELDDNFILPPNAVLSKVTNFDLGFSTGMNFGCVNYE